MNTRRDKLDYLRLLSQQYPSIQAASIAIIELTAQLDLPKGTEHFISDVHGEHEAFIHVIKNGSGFIRRKIDEIFADTMSEGERRNLATLIYYPDRKMPLILQSVRNQAEWFRIVLKHLILVCRSVASKYSRARVRSFLPDSPSDVIEELLYREPYCIRNHSAGVHLRRRRQQFLPEFDQEPSRRESQVHWLKRQFRQYRLRRKCRSIGQCHDRKRREFRFHI